MEYLTIIFGMVPAVTRYRQSKQRICNLNENSTKSDGTTAKKLAPYQLNEIYKSLPLLSNGKLDRQSIIYHLQIDES